MSLLSIEFWIFFLAFFPIYWLLKFNSRLQNIFLLSASYFIIASFSLYFFYILLGYSILIYILSLLLHRFKAKRIKFCAIFLALFPLGLFKYFDFFRIEIQNLLFVMKINLTMPVLDLMLPLGISFYTFHAISYLLSIQKDEIELPVPDSCLLYLAFFPSLIAGPINRAKDLLVQIDLKRSRQIINPQRAFVLILFAMIKVVWLSQFLEQQFVHQVFASPISFGFLQILSAVYAYAFQLYLNFSGYTELVLGIGMLLGFNLPKNFEHAYLALNLQDFWRRWHISLSNFVKDYIYIPLGGNRKGFNKTQINVFLAMVISGFWHGASPNFMIWGALHGIGMIFWNILKKIKGTGKTLKPFWARFFTFHYICFAWIFFRSENLSNAKEIFVSLVNFDYFGTSNFFVTRLLSLLCLFLCFIFYPQIAKISDKIKEQLQKVNWAIFPILFVIIFCIIYELSPSGIPDFIYSRF